jgi:dsRNA-specific ribonuclease
MAEKDPRPHWWTYFVKRNGISPEVYENWNFTKETLAYMTAAARATEIASKMVTYFPKDVDGKTIPLWVFEPCGGIGGNTMAFLENKQISHVVTFERVPERFKMLQRNIMLYNFGSKSTIYNSEFDPIFIQNFPGCVFYFDPPWMSSSVPANVSNPKDFYYKPGQLKVSGYTPEDYLNMYANIVYLMIWRLPPAFIEVPKIEGWKITLDVHKKYEEVQFVTWYCVNKNSELEEFLVERKIELQALTETYKAEVRPASMEKAETVWPIPAPGGKLPAPAPGRKLPAPAPAPGRKLPGPPGAGAGRSLSPSKIMTADDVVDDVFIDLKSKITGIYDVKKGEPWIDGLKKYVSSILYLFTPKPDKYVPLMLNTDEKMAMWARVFTHKSFNENVLENYENIETLGDAVMDFNFKKFHLLNTPDITENLLSEYTSRFLQSNGLNFIAQQLRTNQWCRIKPEVSDKFQKKKTKSELGEDLLESFFGALDLVGDMIRPGFGSCMAYNMVYFIYKDYSFEAGMKYGKPITIITQKLGQALHLIMPKDDSVVHVVASAIGLWNARINLPADWLHFYKIHGMILENPVGVATGESKDSAVGGAWKNAFLKMKDVGITISWAEKIQQETTYFDDLDPALVTMVRSRAIFKGYETIQFYIRRERSTNTVQLFGIDKYKTRVLLSTVNSIDIDVGRKQVLENYRDGK